VRPYVYIILVKYFPLNFAEDVHVMCHEIKLFPTRAFTILIGLYSKITLKEERKQ